MIIYQRLQYWKILRLRGEKNCKICNNKSKSNLNLPEARYFNAGLPNLAKRFCRRLGANHVDTEEWKKKQRRSKRSIWWYAKVIDSPRSFRNNGHDDQDRTVHRRALRVPCPPSTVGPILSLPPLFSISIPWIKAIDPRGYKDRGSKKSCYYRLVTKWQT